MMSGASRRGPIGFVHVLSLMAICVAANVCMPGRVDAQRRETLREIAVIGCESCSDARLLSNVTSLTVTNQGTILVADATRPKVRMFSGAGRLLSAGVTEGRNPGQALLPIALIAARDSSLFVVDMELRRVTKFANWRDAVSAVELAEAPVAVAHRPPHPHIFYATLDYGSTPVVSRVWKLHLGDSVPEMVFESTDGFPRRRDGRPATFFSMAMTPSGGFALGEGAFAYRIRIFDENGIRIRDIERDVPRTTMTELERQRAMERRRLALGRIRSLARLEGGDPGIMEPIESEENYFSADALRFDAMGRLWVKTDRGSGSDTIFDVFEPGGQYTHEVRVGDALGVYDIAEGLLAGFGFGRLDSPLIRLYQVPRR